MKAQKIGVIGMGQMGEAIANGLLNSELKSRFVVTGTTKSKKSADEVRKDHGIECGTDNSVLVRGSEIIILAVKPHQAKTTLEAVKGDFKSNQILISICASITIEQLQEWTGGKPIIMRAMPNTPCLIQKGMTAICGSEKTTEDHLELAGKIFRNLGRVEFFDESLFDGITGLSACGPAYVYLIIEALSEAGVKVGIKREQATLLAAQTLMGASSMVLEGGKHPAALKDEVTTPAGCTIDGLMALEEGALRSTLIKAVWAATKRSQSLRK